jgi:hypothetical protein
MKSILTYAFWLTFIFFVLRVVLNTYTKKGNKDVFVDSCIVFVSCYICEFLSKKIGFRGIEISDVGKPPAVFTDNAGF